MVEHFGPADHWPRHTNKAMRDLLDYARSLGWSLDRHSSKPWGIIWCPEHVHSHSIQSTPEGQEGWCLSTKRRIRQRCEHNNAAQVALTNLETLLRSAETLVAAAETMARRTGKQARLGALLEDTDAEVAAVYALIDEADELESREQELLVDIDPELVMHGPRGMADQAEREARSAEKTRQQVPKVFAAEREDARKRIDRVRERAQVLRNDL